MEYEVLVKLWIPASDVDNADKQAENILGAVYKAYKIDGSVLTVKTSDGR